MSYCLQQKNYFIDLTFTTPWANSADDKFMIFFLIFPSKQYSTFMHFVFTGENLHECQNPFSGKIYKNISTCYLLKILPRELSIEEGVTSNAGLLCK